jgi:hypothetical protein
VICNHWLTDPVRLHGPLWFHFKPLKILDFAFTADPDPAFHSNADPDQAFQSNADPVQAFHSNVDPDQAFYSNADPGPQTYLKLRNIFLFTLVREIHMCF